MTMRITYDHVAPAAVRAMMGLEQYLTTSRIERPLRELVKLRASLLNNCASCIDMHTKDARCWRNRAAAVRSCGVARDAVYSERERAALAWTDAVTRVGETHVPDEVFAVARSRFSEEELVDLTMVVVTINGWNRIAVSFRANVGSYQPRAVWVP